MDASVVSIWLPSAARSPMIRRSDARCALLQWEPASRSIFLKEVHRVETPYLADHWCRGPDAMGHA
jgi:hypothetical protein